MRKGAVPCLPRTKLVCVGELTVLEEVLAASAWLLKRQSKPGMVPLDGLGTSNLALVLSKSRPPLRPLDWSQKSGSLEQLDDTNCKPDFSWCSQILR
jgi:hypothetical protein